MPSLTDRYVYTVLRQTPEAQRADLERELRSSIADLIDAQLDTGKTEAEAEQEALLELGDPDRFAASVSGRPQYLIGPETYPAWLQLLKLLLAIVVPIASTVNAVVLLATGTGIVDAIVGFFVTAVSVGLHIAFWVTLVFVLLERTGATKGAPWKQAWKPDQLPDYAADRRTRLDLASELVWLGVLAVFIIGQQFWSFVIINGERVPVLAPAEWSFWWPYFLVLIVVEALFIVWVWRRGGWSWLAAAINIIIGLAATVPLVYLALEQRIWNPEFFDTMNWTSPEFGITDVVTAVTVMGVVITFIVGAVQAILRARRAQVGLPTQVPGTGVRV